MFDFDRAVGSTIDWIQNNGGWEKNLLIVTADHDHYLTLNPNFADLLATQGAEALTAALDPASAGHYWGANANTKFGWGSHTNRPVPVYYQGPGSEFLNDAIGTGYQSYGFNVPGISGLVDQVHIYQTQAAALTQVPESNNALGAIFIAIFGLFGFYKRDR
jgi:alkaline phosphatase